MVLFKSKRVDCEPKNTDQWWLYFKWNTTCWKCLQRSFWGKCYAKFHLSCDDCFKILTTKRFLLVCFSKFNILFLVKNWNSSKPRHKTCIQLKTGIYNKLAVIEVFFSRSELSTKLKSWTISKKSYVPFQIVSQY